MVSRNFEIFWIPDQWRRQDFLVCRISALENGSHFKLMKKSQVMNFSEKIFAKKIRIFLSPPRKFLILSVVSYCWVYYRTLCQISSTNMWKYLHDEELWCFQFSEHFAKMTAEIENIIILHRVDIFTCLSMKFDIACDSILNNKILQTVLELFRGGGGSGNANFFGKFLFW